MWTDTDGLERICDGLSATVRRAERELSAAPYCLAALCVRRVQAASLTRAVLEGVAASAAPACSARAWMQAGEKQEALYAARVALRTVRVTGHADPLGWLGPC